MIIFHHLLFQKQYLFLLEANTLIGRRIK